MRPVDFVTDFSSHYNLEVGKVSKALEKPMKIFTSDGEMEILSYYYSEEDKCMILDIQEKSM